MTAAVPPAAASRCAPGCPTCADLRRAAIALGGSLGVAAVTPERLAQVAGVPRDAVGGHVCGDADVVVAAAYEELVLGLQARFAGCMRAAATREDGLRDATADLLAYLARHGDAAAFVTVEVVKGGRALLELRERLRRRTVASVRRELARFDGDAVASDLQIEMLCATMGLTIARLVDAGRTAELPAAIEPALALASACAPLPART